MDTKRKIIYKSFRKIELVFFALAFFIPILLFSLPSVKGAFDFNGGNTRIKVYYGEKLLDFKTDAKTLEEALVSQGLRLYDQDKSSVDLKTVLDGDLLEVNIEKSYQIVIKDGEKIIYGRALTKDERESLDQNKISHWPEDIISSGLIIDPVRYRGAGRLIEIKRAPVYYIKFDRKSIEVRDWDGEVGAIIKKGNVNLNLNDIVNHNLKSKLTNGAEINITRINYAEVIETESIDFNTTYRASTALSLGQVRAEISGVKGEKKLTYKITYKDGNEVSRVLVGSSITRQKRDAVILRGAVSGVCKWGPYYETNFGPYTTSFHYRGYVGRYALVTNLANGKSVRVKIVDVGPTNGLLDLSTTAMREIGGPLATFHGSIPSVMVQIVD